MFSANDQQFLLEFMCAASHSKDFPNDIKNQIINSTLKRYGTLGSLVNSGIQDLINTSVKSCNQQFHDVLFKNIVISGGNSVFPEFPERISSEVQKVAHLDSNSVQVIASPQEQRIYSAWKGGALVGAQKEKNPPDWIPREIYNEKGVGACS